MISLHKLEIIKSDINALEMQREAYLALVDAVPAIDYERDRVDISLNQDPSFVILYNKIADLEARIRQLHILYLTKGAELADSITALHGLTDLQREILFHKYVKLETLSQISDLLQISYNATKRHHQVACRLWSMARADEASRQAMI